jgi:hypothetical protein
VAQEIEGLPSKHEALRLNTQNAKKKKKKEEEEMVELKELND